jgi:hypothetical protein
MGSDECALLHCRMHPTQTPPPNKTHTQHSLLTLRYVPHA